MKRGLPFRDDFVYAPESMMPATAKGEMTAMGARKIITVAALAVGLSALGAGPAFADEAPGTNQPKKAKPDTSRRVCRSLVPTGSRMSGRVCKTQAEWDAARDKQADGLLRHQSTHETLMEQAPRGI